MFRIFKLSKLGKHVKMSAVSHLGKIESDIYI